MRQTERKKERFKNMDPKCFLVACFFHLNPNLGSSSLVDDVVRFGLRWNGLLGYEFPRVVDARVKLRSGI